MVNLFKNNSIEFNIKKKTFHIKIKNLTKIPEEQLELVIFYFNFYNFICFENNIKFMMVIDFMDSNISFNALSYVNLFVKTLNFINPVMNEILLGTFILIPNETVKLFINAILNIYKNSKPIYIINSKKDITDLLE